MTYIKREIGNWGEDLACKYLEQKGYKIIDRNFRKKWGEIDIVATKSNVPRRTVYAERSQSVPRGTLRKNPVQAFWSRIKSQKAGVNKMGKEKDKKAIVFVEVKTIGKGLIRPEDNITQAKMRKLIRTCQLYLSEKRYSLDETDWQIDTIGIVVDKNGGDYEVEHIEQAVY